MIRIRDKKSKPIGNSQLSKTGYESGLLYYTVTSIEEKVFTFNHGLKGTMNKRKFVLQALLTRIRLGCVYLAGHRLIFFGIFSRLSRI